MIAGKPVVINKIHAEFGAEVPFIRNGTNDVVVGQSFLIHYTIVNTETLDIVDEITLTIEQNSTHNELIRDRDVEYTPDRNNGGIYSKTNS